MAKLKRKRSATHTAYSAQDRKRKNALRRRARHVGDNPNDKVGKAALDRVS